MIEISLSDVTVVKETKSFVIEASDLNGKFATGGTTRIEDMRTKITNPKTGNSPVFMFFRVECDAEGDITGWEFAPTPISAGAYPKVAGWKLTIFND